MCLLEISDMYKLRSWIPENKLFLHILCKNKNPGVLRIFEKNKDKIDWNNLSKQSYAIHLLKQNLDKVDWDALCLNESAIDILCKNPDKINWFIFSRNKHPDIVSIIEKNWDKILLEDQREDVWSDGTLTFYIILQNLLYHPNSLPFIEKHIENLDWKLVSENSNMISIIEKNLDKVDWNKLCNNKNKKVLEILEKNIDKVNWDILSSNPIAVSFLEKHMDKINWVELSSNSRAVDLLEKNIDKICWESIVYNTNPRAISLIEQNLYHLNTHTWASLTLNENAVHLFRKNIDKIHLPYLLFNKHPDAIKLFEENITKVTLDDEDIEDLSIKPHLVPFFEKNVEYINWYNISKNEGIFEYDYENIKKRMSIFEEELVQKVFHPRNYHKFVDWGYEEFKD